MISLPTLTSLMENIMADDREADDDEEEMKRKEEEAFQRRVDDAMAPRQ